VIPENFFGPRAYTPAELRMIDAFARRLLEQEVARLYLDIARWERGERDE
jgi:hypothetical protein